MLGFSVEQRRLGSMPSRPIATAARGPMERPAGAATDDATGTTDTSAHPPMNRSGRASVARARVLMGNSAQLQSSASACGVAAVPYRGAARLPHRLPRAPNPLAPTPLSRPLFSHWFLSPPLRARLG